MNEWVELGQNKDGTHNICCGVCGVGKFKSRGHARSYYTRHKFKYCPNCGAKMNEADRKDEPRKEQNFCGKCRYLYRDFKYGLSCYRLMDNEPCKYEERKDEPQTERSE